jgi:glutaredoxin
VPPRRAVSEWHYLIRNYGESPLRGISRAATIGDATDTQSKPTVAIYSLTTCQWCARAKAFFRARGITPLVVEYDMAGPELQAKIAAELRAHGASGFPFVKIGGRVVPGYDPGEYERLLRAG